MFVKQSPFLLLLGALGCLSTVLRADSDWSRWLFVSWLAGVSVFFSFLRVQGPWLGYHILLPMAILAGLGLADVIYAGRVVLSSLEINDSPSGTGAVLGVSVLLVLASFAALAPYSPGQSVDVLSNPYPEDRYEDSFGYIRKEAQQARCPIVVDPDVPDHPSIRWWLRGLQHERTDWHESMSPAIYITPSLSPLPGQVGVTQTTRSGWHIYVPSEPCPA